MSASSLRAYTAAYIATIDIIKKEPQRVESLWDKASYFRKAVQDPDLTPVKARTPIIPIIVGESCAAKPLSARLFEATYLPFPTFPWYFVARPASEDIDFAIGALEKAGKELSII